MNRNDFGLWGIELNDSEFAQALAALGVLAGEKLLPPTNFIESFQKQDYLKRILDLVEKDQHLKWTLDDPYLIKMASEGSLPPEKTLIAVWKAITEHYGEDLENIGSPYFDSSRKTVKLELVFNESSRFTPEPDYFWLLEQLAHPDVKASSVCVLRNDETAKMIWDYPLRIGFLNDPRSQQLVSKITKLKFRDQLLVGTHINLVEISGGNNDCDILLLPYDLRKAVVALIEGPNSLRADCVMIIGNVDESKNKRLLPLLDAVRTQARASCVCLSPIPFSEDDETDITQIWFKQLIREISHNTSLDVALFRACRNPNVQALPPRIFCCREFTERARISNRIERFREQISDARLQNLKAYIPIPTGGMGEYIEGKQGTRPSSITEISESFDSRNNLLWDREIDTATRFSKTKKATAKAMREAPLTPPKPRWIQTEIWEHVQGKPRKSVSKSPGLQRNTGYSIEVYIGKKSKNAISADKTFNDELLPPGKNEHELLVFFTEPNISPEPKIAKITLPRKGDSTHCEFFIQVPEKIESMQARIIIAYKNRILQTALLTAAICSVDGEFSKDTEKKKIKLQIESVLRPGLADLTQRKPFDAAFLVNADDAGTHRLTQLVGEKGKMISIEGLAGRIKWFDDKISEVADKWKKFEKLENVKSQDLLRSCASNGAALYKALRGGWEEGALLASERVQIVTAKYGSRLPLEFVYDRLSPNSDAKLCPNAQKALANGRCDGSCPKDREIKTVICPLGFWGLSKVIERHAYDASAIKTGADFALLSEPIGERTKLNVLNNAVMAFSRKVDEVDTDASKKVIDALDIATAENSHRVDSWSDWETDIKARSPSLLVLLPHTLTDAQTDQMVLEISQDERLMFADLESEYVLGPRKNPSPVVILMGCETASPDIPYESFILEFRRLGAALVVGTGSTILGRHAATVTTEFISSVSKIDLKNITFGDLMLKVRRKMVAEGTLMALCLTSYGDTDWTM